MKGLKSPWGSMASICSQFHWTFDYLLWGVSWVNVQMMLTDMPWYDYDAGKTDQVKAKAITTEDELTTYIEKLNETI